MNDFATVFQAELLRRVKSRPFRIGLIIGVCAIALFTKLPQWIVMATQGATHTIVVVADPPLSRRAAALLAKDFTIAAIVPLQTPGPALLERHRSSLAVTVRSSGQVLAIGAYAKDPGNVPTTRLRQDLVPLQFQIATALRPEQIDGLLKLPIGVHAISSKFASSAASQAAHAIAFTLIFFLYMLISLNSQLLMSSVAEEKTSRIAELLVASVDPVALLAGKIASAAVLALLQLAIWIAAAAVLSLGSTPASGGSGMSFDFASLLTGNVITPGVMVAFILFFVLGLLQLSTLFAALASLINRTEDLGSVAVPLVIPVAAAFIIAMTALDVPDAGWVVGLSFVPLLSPFVMFARIVVSDVPVWQIVLSLAINAVALGLIALAAGKVYRVGMLLYGRSPNLSQVWSVIRS